jgi:uncharacterized tellurite resistance protein B-like protein
MLDPRRFLERYLNPGDRDASAAATSAVDLAVAALLIEVLRADLDVGAAERAQLAASVGALLGLEEQARAALVADAEKKLDAAHDLHQFTRQVNSAFSDAQKVQLLEQLWRVARADAIVHKYEEHLIRRVADLLHVPHSGFIASKLRSEGSA